MCSPNTNETLSESEQKQAWNQPVPGAEPEGGRKGGLSERYRKIAPQVKEMYERNDHSTDATREMFQIKSQPTLYKILQFAGSNVKGFLKMRGNTNQKQKSNL